MSAANVLELFDRDVEFMTFFYEHLTACPPHGPFRLYSAITFVERARRRFAVKTEAAPWARHGPRGQEKDEEGALPRDSDGANKRARVGESGDANASASPVPQGRNTTTSAGEGDNPEDGGDALQPSTFAAANTETGLVFQRERRRLLEALTTHNVLILIESKYNTTHLSGWPLMYVPAEVHSAEVATVMEEQQKGRA